MTLLEIQLMNAQTASGGEFSMGANVGGGGSCEAPMASNDYKQGDNKFTGKIAKVTIDLSPSKLSDADEKKVEEAGQEAATIED